MLDSYHFYKVKLKLSSLLEGLCSPKLDMYNSRERSPDGTPPPGTSNVITIGSRGF